MTVKGVVSEASQGREWTIPFLIRGDSLLTLYQMSKSQRNFIKITGDILFESHAGKPPLEKKENAFMLNRCLINLTLDNIIMCDSFNHENSLIRVLTKGSDSDLVNCVDQWTLIRTVDGATRYLETTAQLGQHTCSDNYCK